MSTELLIANLLSPPILFFGLGMLARGVKSELEIPEAIGKLFSIYLLWAIGFKGGVELRSSFAAAPDAGAGVGGGGIDGSAIGVLVAAVMLSALWPLVVYPILRRGFASADAAATAAAYGSVSVVTFITAANFLEVREVPYSGFLVAALALMEFPAIVTAVILYRSGMMKAAGEGMTGGLGGLMREALLGGPVFLLVGSMLVGLLSSPAGVEKLAPFTQDVFQGVLVLFLIDSGMKAASGAGELLKRGVFAVATGVVIPIAAAAVALGVALLVGAEPGDGFLLMILSASASYIAVPAAMRHAIPEANAGVYLPMALAVTFPFNITIGIPVYLWAAEAMLG